MTNSQRQIEFASLCALSLIAGGHVLVGAVRLGLGNEGYTHILLILPITVAMILVEWPLLVPRFGSGARPGLTLLCISLSMAWLSSWESVGLRPDLHLSAGVLALVIWWIGAFVLCFGAWVSRSLVFPLCFLLWIVPIPVSALNWIVEWLQQQSAMTARIMFGVAGVPVTQDGIMLSIPGLDIEVARECSSIRSSLVLVIITMVLGHLLLRSWWRKSLLVTAAIPLSVVKNGFRIFLISELGTRVDPSFFDGRLHHHGGIVFLIIALGPVALLLWLLRSTEARNPRKLDLFPAPE